MDDLEQYIKQTEEILRIVDRQKSTVQEHRQTSHERLFKLILNVSTLTLTGWVAIVAWNPAGFEYFKSKILLSSAFLMSTLVLIAISDLLLIIQSWLLEISLTKHQGQWLTAKSQIERNRIAAGGKHFASISGMAQSLIASTAKKLEADTDKNSLLTKRMLSWSWKSGIAASMLFFLAISVSMYYMTTYISFSQSLKTTLLISTARDLKVPLRSELSEEQKKTIDRIEH